MKMTIEKQVTKTLKVSIGDTLILRGEYSPNLLLVEHEGYVLAVSLNSGKSMAEHVSVREILNRYKDRIVDVKRGPLSHTQCESNFILTETVHEEVDIRVGSLITYESEKRLVVSAGGRFHSVDPDNFASQGNYATIAELVHQGRYIYGTIEDVQKVQL